MSRPCQNAMEMKICKELKEKTGVEYAPCRGIMITEEEQKNLYPNFDYFLDLAFSGEGLWSYYSKGKVPCTWGTSNKVYDTSNKSNPKKLIPTWHELFSIYSDFDIDLYGKYLCKDTRECTVDPPYIWVSFDVKDDPLNLEKKKLPAGWHRKKNTEKDKWYYWEDGSNQSQWNHPCSTLMDILDRNIDNFEYVSDNFAKSIHGNMDFKDTSFVEILGLKMITKE